MAGGDERSLSAFLRMDPRTLPRLSDGALRHVESELYTYHATRRAIEQRRLDIIEGGHRADPGEQPPRRNEGAWTDPTSFRGSLLAEDLRIREMRRIIEAIDDAIAALRAIRPACGDLVRLWYWERLPVEEVAAALHVSRETVYRLRRGLQVAVAARLGWE